MSERSLLSESVVVQVVDVRSGREISWGNGMVERLKERVDDIREAITAGAQAVALDIDKLPSQKGWQPSELSVSFGITLAAEAGVVLSRASAETAFEVTITFQRT